MEDKNLIIEKIQLDFHNSKVNALCFIPLNKAPKKLLAAFSHGYTSHKASILSWPSKLIELNVPCVIFDLPGHYLGSYCEVESTDQFIHDTPRLFSQAMEKIIELLNKNKLECDDQLDLVIGGHSLGGLFSLLALEEKFPTFKSLRAIVVGLGLPPQGQTHVFKSALFKDTIALRSELVSAHIPPDFIFPWIKKTKEELQLTHQHVHFLTGEDDIVVGKNGTERLKEVLDNNGNITSLEKPKRLSHHLPDMAGTYIKKYIKKEFNLSDI